MTSGILASTASSKQTTIPELRRQLEDAEAGLQSSVAKLNTLTLQISSTQNQTQKTDDELNLITKKFQKELLDLVQTETTEAQSQVNTVTDKLYQATCESASVRQENPELTITRLFRNQPKLQTDFTRRFRRNSISSATLDEKIVLLRQELSRAIEDPKHDLTSAADLTSAIKSSREAGAVRFLTNEQLTKSIDETRGAHDSLRTLKKNFSHKTSGTISLTELVQLTQEIDATKARLESLQNTHKTKTLQYLYEQDEDIVQLVEATYPDDPSNQDLYFGKIENMLTAHERASEDAMYSPAKPKSVYRS